MRSTVLALAVAVLLAASGCVGTTPGGGATATGSPTATAAPTGTATPTETVTPTETTTQTETYSVEYVVSAGEVPDEIGSVEVTLQVIFVEKRTDLARCWDSTFKGPYRPTITPIPPPEGGCGRGKKVTVDLTEVEGTRSLGEFTVSGPYSAGHGLIATEIRATYRNGTTVRRFLGADGARVAVVEGVPNGTHRVELWVHAWDEPTSGGALYSLASERGNRSGRLLDDG